jgi:hypothetical protein
VIDTFLLNNNHLLIQVTQVCLYPYNFLLNNNHLLMSKWLLFNANSAIFMLYDGRKKLIFSEMMMMSALY